MMKVNDFQKYEVTLMISYEDYFRLIYESKYLLEARLGTDRMFIARKAIYGNNRRKAVQKAVQWFWKDFKGVLGPAHKVMTINDPFEEVAYDEGFACNDLANKYLDGDTTERLLAQADGDLACDDSTGSENHPPNSVKRIKRRRKENILLAPRLFQTPGGTIYYKMTEPAIGKGCRAKTKTVRLSSKSLEKALKEVDRRGLNKFEKFGEMNKLKKANTRLAKQAA